MVDFFQRYEYIRDFIAVVRLSFSAAPPLSHDKPPPKRGSDALRPRTERRHAGKRPQRESRRTASPHPPETHSVIYRKKFFIRSKMFWFLTDSARWNEGCPASCSTMRFSSAVSFAGTVMSTTINSSPRP